LGCFFAFWFVHDSVALGNTIMWLTAPIHVILGTVDGSRKTFNLGVVLIQMKFMNDAMCQRRKDNAECCYEHQADKHAVYGKEQFANGGFRNDIWTDAAYDKSGIQHRVVPVDGFQPEMGGDPDHDGSRQDQQRIKHVDGKPVCKVMTGQKGLIF